MTSWVAATPVARLDGCHLETQPWHSRALEEELSSVMGIICIWAVPTVATPHVATEHLKRATATKTPGFPIV